MSQQIILSHHINAEIEAILHNNAHDKCFVLTDETTHRLCRPLTAGSLPEASTRDIVIGATDVHKTLDTLADVWRALVEGGASRRSLMVCLGGGMVTDLGGFAASTFKRGIRFVHVPTTLLSMVDAAVGGKTGINFCGLKNEIGAFSDSIAVIIDSEFLRTLDAPNLCSGYAEMIKHALLRDEAMWAEHMAFDIAQPDLVRLQHMVGESIATKSDIVRQDPHEQGLRKALNLGHTTGHALESLAMEKGRPVLHGYAVAWGIVCELYLSTVLCGFPVERMRQTVQYIRDHYGRPDIGCDDYDHLYALMLHDKKNAGGEINFTLLHDIGRIALDQHASRELISEALDFLREA